MDQCASPYIYAHACYRVSNDKGPYHSPKLTARTELRQPPAGRGEGPIQHAPCRGAAGRGRKSAIHSASDNSPGAEWAHMLRPGSLTPALVSLLCCALCQVGDRCVRIEDTSSHYIRSAGCQEAVADFPRPFFLAGSWNRVFGPSAVRTLGGGTKQLESWIPFDVFKRPDRFADELRLHRKGRHHTLRAIEHKDVAVLPHPWARFLIEISQAGFSRFG
jgi:hypothetical protein